MKHHLMLTATAAIAAVLFFSCSGNNKTGNETPSKSYSLEGCPTFCQDSAYSYVAEQLAFGFRAPGHKGHEQCAKYLVGKLSQYCDTAIVQPFSAKLWDGTTAKGENIIGIINPAATSRVLLAAHWDSRLWADNDPDQANWHKPIMGANDGASGVGVLIELARVLHSQPQQLGVDIVFFDLEDQGTPEWAEQQQDDTWCKGAQYWAKTPHRPYYQAKYGVLLDMVGTSNPRFTKEQFSMQYASTVTNKLWQIADALGYGGVFQNQQTAPILDDHLYVNRYSGIPMADIVQNTPQCSFYPYWHTVNDNLDAVDRQTLGKVGNVLVCLIYKD